MRNAFQIPRRWRRALVACAPVALSIALAACGGDSPSPAPTPPPACTAPCINAAGGAVAGPAGSAINIPAGALNANTTIIITTGNAAPAPIPGQFIAAGSTYAFEPHGTTFSVPATITVPLDPAQIGAGDTPQLVRIGQGQTNWAAVTGATRSGNAMTAQVNSFSWYAVVKAAIAPTITTQPADVAVNAGQTAMFSVVAAGSPTLAYQWRRNGADIAAATAAAYVTPATVAGDNGAKFSVRVSNGAGSVVSNEATLTVNVAPPTVDLRGFANLSPQSVWRSWPAGFTVRLFDVNGAQRTAPLAADGRFTIADVGGLTAPFLIVPIDANGAGFGYTAVLRDKPATSIDIHVNIVASAIAAAALGKSLLSVASDVATASDSAKLLTAANVDAALARFRTTFGPTVTVFGGAAASFDPATSPQSAALDDAMQWVTAAANGDTGWISGNALLPANAGVLPTTIGTALPAAASAEVGQVKPLLAALEACFKLPVADRATVDANGAISALKGACAAMPVASNYSNNLSSFVQRYWDWLLDPATKDALFGAFVYGMVSAEEPVVAIYYRAQASGKGDHKFDTLARTAAGATTWHLVGNRRKYEMFSQTEFHRVIYLNPTPAGQSTIFGTSHLTSGIYFRFDPTRGGANDVRAVRIKGRGLPAAGLVMTRSTSCDRADRLVIANKTGDASVASSGNRTQTFLLSAEPTVPFGFLGPWSPADSSFADAPLTPADHQLFGALEPYTWEIFKVTDAMTPSETIVTRLGNRPTHAGGLRDRFPWSELDTATLAYLSPSTPQAAASPTLPMTWVLGSGHAAIPGPTDAYSFTRGTIDGVNNKRVYDGFTFLPGSTTSVTFNSNTPPAGESNPCTGSAFPALTTTVGIFRGVGLFWNYGSIRYLSEHMWQAF